LFKKTIKLLSIFLFIGTIAYLSISYAFSATEKNVVLRAFFPDGTPIYYQCLGDEGVKIFLKTKHGEVYEGILVCGKPA